MRGTEPKDKHLCGEDETKCDPYNAIPFNKRDLFVCLFLGDLVKPAINSCGFRLNVWLVRKLL